MTIGILILNYLAYKDTLECLESIKRQSYEDYQVLVVDNASSNNSYAELQQCTSGDSKVTILQTKENLGFARGNNFGLAWFKSKNIYNVLVINGDTILTDTHYLQSLVEFPLAEDIAMIGTKIISRDQQNQNPLPVNLTDISKLKAAKKQLWLLKILNNLHLIETLSRIKNKLVKKNESELDLQDTSVKEKWRNLNPSWEMLHGSAIFFTENYLSQYIGFYPDTFLYYEEELLALVCRKLDMKQVYAPELSIYHKEDASSNLASGNNSAKALDKKIAILSKNVAIMERALNLSDEEFKAKMENGNLC